MTKINFYQLGNEEKAAVFNEVAVQIGINPFAVEKDWWVSRTLEIIFQMPISQHLVFKGGTSLSKAWKLINRFSEDIDLAIDPKFFGFIGDLGKSQRDKLKLTSGAYTTGIFFEDLKQAFQVKGINDAKFVVIESKDSEQDPRVLEIYYPQVINSDSEYLFPRVQIEISCRSLKEPYSVQTFGSMVDEYYADKSFTDPLFEVPTVHAERTFLEKLFLLHEEFHRPTEKIRVNRLSRHLYDVYHLTKAGVAEKAIHDKLLYETIVAHRYKFSRVGEVDYNLHHPETLNPIPPDSKIAAWEADYTKMKENMIYEIKKPTFQELIENVNLLKGQLQTVEWKFDLRFPPRIKD